MTWKDVIFQSTLTAWGATSAELSHFILMVISIHAPRRGSDGMFMGNHGAGMQFQSTLPAGGATVQSKHTAMTA